MKKIFLAFIALSLFFVPQSCKKDLPYPIDEVTRGVLIDVYRLTGTDAVLEEGNVSSICRVKLSIPEKQGDYSFMKCAQLVAVLQGADKKMSTAVVQDNITQFPIEITLNLAEVYGKLGKSGPTAGEILYITANVVKNDGLVIPGWTEKTGFNNVDFAGWQVEGRNYSSNVRYPVVKCLLNINSFVGTAYVTLDEWWEEEYEVEIVKVSDSEIQVLGMIAGEADKPLSIKINADYTVTIPRQIIVTQSGYWWDPINGRPTYNDFSLEGSGIIDACELVITFTATCRVQAGSFGNCSFEIRKNLD